MNAMAISFATISNAEAEGAVAKAMHRLFPGRHERAASLGKAVKEGEETRPSAEQLSRQLEEAVTRAEQAESDLAKERLRADALDARLSASDRGAIAALSREFRDTVATIAHSLGTASHELETSSHMMRSFAETTARELVGVAAAADTSAQHARKLVIDARALHESVATVDISWAYIARIGAEARQRTETSEQTIRELDESSRKLGKVLGVIGDIADQTRMLALNATIEAARSGAAGRAFAVVADEVKSLAHDVRAVTGGATILIDGMRVETGNTEDAVRNVNNVVERLLDSADAISLEVSEQQAKSVAIQKSSENGAEETSSLAGRCDKLSNVASESIQLSVGLESSATTLSQTIEKLEAATERFLAQMEAAN
jgi:methyl-accepting chemotaxis protein